MGSGYRSDRAREIAGRAVRDYQRSKQKFADPGTAMPVLNAAPGMHDNAFESVKHPDYMRDPTGNPLNRPPHLQYDFLAPPGFTPPPAAGTVVAPAAAASGGAWAWLGGIGIGLGLGFWVKEDIDRFKKNAKLPWYDTAYPYRGGRNHWVTADWDRGQEVKWDLDDWLNNWWWQERIREMEANFSFDQLPLWQTAPDQGVGPDGWHHPYWDWNWCSQPHPECDATGAWGFRSGTASGYNYSTSYCPPGSCGSQILTSAPRAPLQADPYNGWLQDTGWLTIGGYKTISTNPTRARGRGAFGANGLGDHTLPLWEQAVVSRAIPIEEYQYGHGEPLSWPDAVAPLGSQPSLAQQQASQRLPRGKQRAGYTVPFSLRHPFTRVVVRPGSPPVTVPDQVIDPGSETEPGGVVIVPPGLPPGNPNPDEEKEAKPWPQRLIHMGFTAINVVTETQDFLEAMHAALPKKYRSRGRNGGDVPPWVILQDIWDNWDHFDADLAVENFVNNQIEDAIYGRFFGFQSRVQRKAGVTAGLGRGVKGYRPTKLVVPEVHFADGNFGIQFGEWSIGE